MPANITDDLETLTQLLATITLAVPQETSLTQESPSNKGPPDDNDDDDVT
jgi:hypothetical protein